MKFVKIRPHDEKFQPVVKEVPEGTPTHKVVEAYQKQLNQEGASTTAVTWQVK